MLLELDRYLKQRPPQFIPILYVPQTVLTLRCFTKLSLLIVFFFFFNLRNSERNPNQHCLNLSHSLLNLLIKVLCLEQSAYSNIVCLFNFATRNRSGFISRRCSRTSKKLTRTLWCLVTCVTQPWSLWHSWKPLFLGLKEVSLLCSFKTLNKSANKERVLIC